MPLLSEAFNTTVWVPTSKADGFPERTPVVEFIDSQLGLVMAV